MWATFWTAYGGGADVGRLRPRPPRELGRGCDRVVLKGLSSLMAEAGLPCRRGVFAGCGSAGRRREPIRISDGQSGGISLGVVWWCQSGSGDRRVLGARTGVDGVKFLALLGSDPRTSCG